MELIWDPYVCWHCGSLDLKIIKSYGGNSHGDVMFKDTMICYCNNCRGSWNCNPLSKLWLKTNFNNQHDMSLNPQYIYLQSQLTLGIHYDQHLQPGETIDVYHRTD